MEQTGVKRTAACYPSADEINALPEKFRRYIHDLETRCDKTFGALRLYQRELDQGRVLSDVMVIADEVDAQLMETVRALLETKEGPGSHEKHGQGVTVPRQGEA